jgi:hypothetical protein
MLKSFGKKPVVVAVVFIFGIQIKEIFVCCLPQYKNQHLCSITFVA